MESNKCRICLGNKKNVRSIFEKPSQDDEYSFAHMITSIARIKIGNEDGITDKICLPCRKKVIDAFDLKIQIERSDAALQSTATSRKIMFDGLNDIKFQVEVKIPKVERSTVDYYFKEGETSTCYNDTIIKKVNPYDIDIENDSGPLSVLDFLNTIKEEDENDFNDDYDVDYKPISDGEDDDYLLPLNKRVKHKKRKRTDDDYVPSQSKIVKHKKQKKQGPAMKTNLKKVCIKPVFLSDLKVLPTQPRPKPRMKKKCIRAQPRSMCNVCGKMVTSIKQHILTHTGERSFKCEKCDKGFLSEKDLVYHKKRWHATEKKFKCDKCIAAFTHLDSLRSHMIRHDDRKDFVCDICSKGFKRQGALRRHKIIHNIANKCIKCDLCNMTFFSKYGLNHHLRIHTGERPYNCEICSQPYSYKHDFNRHCFKKHGVFLKRRSVKVMNEEVLKREQELMRDLLLKLHGFVKEGEPLNPFDGPQGYLAFETAVAALQAKQIPIIDYNI